MKLEKPGKAPQTSPMSPTVTCNHSRLISHYVSEKEHKAGKVRCVECGTVIPDPHLQRVPKGT